MRILVLSFYYEPDLSAGSFRTTALVAKIQEQLSEFDSLDVITTMPNRYGSFTDKAIAETYDGKVRINRIDVGRHNSGFVDQSILFIKFAIKATNIIRKRDKYDIIYATSSRLMTAFLGAVTANRQKAKLYLDIRDIFTDTMESIFAGNWKRYLIPMFRYIEKYTILSAKHINLVSAGFSDYFQKISNKPNYSFFTNGIDDVFLHTDFREPPETDKTVITYAGNIGEGQGLDKIVPQMAKLLGNDYEIQIIGDGGAKQNLMTAIDGLSNVRVLPPVKRSELLEIYNQSHCLFMHLNDYEAFKKVLPSKVFEYAATGRFIIAGVGGYSASFVLDNIDGSIVFKPCDADDFINKFKSCKREKMYSRQAFIKKYTRENIMSEMAHTVLSL